MKKKLIIFLLLVISITLVGCGTKEENNENEKEGEDSYVEQTKKATYIDTMNILINSARTKVNEGKDLRFFSTDVLYMISVENNCVSTETGAKSPYNSGWNYAYVGVTYNEMGYTYYIIAEDNGGVGIPMLSNKELNDNGKDYIYKKYASNLGKEGITKEFANTLKNTYGTKVVERALTSDEKTAFAEAINGDGYTKTKILYTDNNCKYE